MASKDWGCGSGNGVLLREVCAIRHVAGVDRPHNLHNVIQLIGFVFAWEDRLAKQQLCKDAAYGPHIDFRTVFLRTQQELRRSAHQTQPANDIHQKYSPQPK